MHNNPILLTSTYHTNKPYWNTTTLDNDMSIEQLKWQAEHTETGLSCFTRKKAPEKLREGSSQHTLTVRRIAAFQIAEELITEKLKELEDLGQ